MKMQKFPTYEAPRSGDHVATLVKIADIGVQKTAYGEKAQVRLRFDVEEKDSRGQKKFVTKTFTNSLHEKSNFAKFFAEIGKPIPADDDVDTDNLLGVQFTLKLKQVKVDGKARIRIAGVGPLSDGE